jgi:hypothetical protein
MDLTSSEFHLLHNEVLSLVYRQLLTQRNQGINDITVYVPLRLKEILYEVLTIENDTVIMGPEVIHFIITNEEVPYTADQAIALWEETQIGIADPSLNDW